MAYNELYSLGGVNTDDATATVSQILSGYTAYVKGTKITGNIPSQGAQTITPGTTNKTISSGRYLSGTQTIKGDSNLVAGNIKKGASIFGVSGTYTSDANATAANILSGKTAYVNGSKITGSMKSNNYGDHALSDGINDKGYYMYFTDGYYPHDGWKGGWVYRTQAETAKCIGLTAAKLASGQTVLGIKGTYSGNGKRIYGNARSSSNEIVFYDQNGGYHTWPYIKITNTGNLTPLMITLQYNSKDLSVASDYWNLNLIGNGQWFALKSSGNFHWNKNDIQVPVQNPNTSYTYSLAVY